jgi:hypothetical protein
MDYKYDKIKNYFLDFINDNDDNFIVDNWNDLHHHAFNTDGYLIYTNDAVEWLGNQTLQIINFIKYYEMDNFGEVYTDFSDACKIVNMYVYIIGLDIVSDWQNENKHFKNYRAIYEKIEDEISQLRNDTMKAFSELKTA